MIDEKELRYRLMELFAELAGVGSVTDSMPMTEVRERTELAAKLFARAYTVCMHEGPIGANIAVDIRAAETLWRELMLDTTGRVFGPGGQAREILNARAGLPRDKD